MGQVYLPREIVNAFITVAKPNTTRLIETGAILGGQERDGSFIITTLIVPKQDGEQDKFVVTDEMSLFNAQESRSLLTIGWIHTHP